MSYIGIDLGNKRCGLAVEIEGIIVPKKIVARVGIIKEIKKLIKEYKAEVIVIGLPYDLYGKDNTQLEKTKKFIEKLKVIFPDIKIEGVDERFTSFEADIILDEIGIKNKAGKKDDLSAVLILETYLKNKK